MNRDDRYYQAMLARDSRYDGKFFVGVKTTGIYCRPICPARPKRKNIEFFSTGQEAEKAGYRPCLRCRPQAAPSSPAWIGKTAVVQRAVKVLRQEKKDRNAEEFAEHFGMTARHLRRLFREALGKTPKQLASETRLEKARAFVTETKLPLADIAFLSGFQSVRRFNDAFKQHFQRNPTEFRRRR